MDQDESGVVDALNERRDTLLLHMYDQMFNDINRHILVVWQSVGTLIGAFAIFALAEKEIITVDVASALLIVIAGWLLAHLYDASYWYNRNLVIIANIERNFLSKEDLRRIHYYFGKHRPSNKMIKHLQIQYALGVGIGVLVLVFHFLTRVMPGMTADSRFDPVRALPYAAALLVIVYLFNLRRHRSSSYDEFVAASPGIDVDAEGIKYGIGHGYPKLSNQ